MIFFGKILKIFFASPSPQEKCVQILILVLRIWTHCLDLCPDTLSDYQTTTHYWKLM